MAQQFSMGSFLPILQAMTQYIPQAQQMGQMLQGGGVNLPTQASGGGGLSLSKLGRQQPNLTMNQAPGSNASQAEWDAYTRAQDLAIAAQDAATPVMPGKMGMWENVFQRGSIKEARNQAVEAQRDLQELQRLEQQRQTAAAAQSIYSAARPLVGDQQARNYTQLAEKHPSIIEPMMTSLIEQEALMEQRQYDEGIEAQQRDASYNAAIRMGVPQSYAAAASLAGLSPDQIAENYRSGVNWNEERAQAVAQESTRTRDEILKIEQGLRTVDKAIDNVSWLSVGPVGYLTQAIPATPGQEFDAVLETLKAMTGFKALYDMRQASTTGGALGNVSNMEVKLLYNAWTQLNQAAGPEAQVTALNELKDQWMRVNYLLQQSEEGNLDGVSGSEQARMANEYVENYKIDQARPTGFNDWRNNIGN